MAWYQVTLEGARCHHETWDHAWEVDGKHDEIYFHYGVQLVDPAGKIALNTSDRTPVLGDTNGFPNRIRAGSASDRGGIRNGDLIDHRVLLWQGDLQPGWGVAITPTIWEWDGGADLLNTWGQSFVTHGPAIAEAVMKVIQGPGGSGEPGTPAKGNFIIDAIKSGLPALFALITEITGKAKDRPIGTRDKAFTAQTVVLNDQLAAQVTNNSFGDRGPGGFPINYADDARLQGNYSIYLRVASLEPFDGMLVHEPSDPAIFVLFGGAKFWLPNNDWVERYGGGRWMGPNPPFMPNRVFVPNDKLRVMPAGYLATIPAVPRDGTLLKEWSSAPVYLMKGGQRCWITSPDRFQQLGLNWAQVRVVPDGALATIPPGPDA
jgi:hypothetical protein